MGFSWLGNGLCFNGDARLAAPKERAAESGGEAHPVRRRVRQCRFRNRYGFALSARKLLGRRRHNILTMLFVLKVHAESLEYAISEVRWTRPQQ